jgi:phosphatidylglycerophosphatase A
VDRFVLFAASGAYLGFSPVAPGTCGSVLALPLLVACARLGSAATAVIALTLIAAAVPVCARAGALWGQTDSPRIVLDEVCGMLLAGAFLPPTPWTLALAFLAFRLFDVVKPFPAGYFDRNVKNGFGVVADDLVAGVYANLVVRLLT